MDGGTSWVTANVGLYDLTANTLSVAPTYPLTPILLAGTMESMDYSGNEGDTWESEEQLIKPYGVSYPMINDIAFSPGYADDSTIWLGTAIGLLHSNQSAQQWGAPMPAARYGHSAIYDATNARMIVFGGYGSGYLNDVWSLSLQAPLLWTQHPTDAVTPDSQDYFSGRDMSLLAVSPGFGADHTLFLVSADQLYHTADAGVNWDLRATLPGITDLLLSPAYASDHTLYAVAAGDVYRSTDEGVTRTALNEGLNANTISVASEGQSWTLFAAVQNGVWRYTFPQPEAVRTLILTHQDRLRARCGGGPPQRPTPSRRAGLCVPGHSLTRPPMLISSCR